MRFIKTPSSPVKNRHAPRLGLAARRDFEIPNAALNRIEIAGDDWSVLVWAERAHLETAIDDLPD